MAENTRPLAAPADLAPPATLWNRHYLLLWAGQFASKLGDQAFNIAIVLWITQTIGSATLMGLILSLASLPALLLAPLGGAIADRYPRRTIIILCDAARGLAVLSLGLVFFLAPGQTGLHLAWLIGVALALAIIAPFFGPAIMASLPDLVPRDRLPNANALGQLSTEFSLIVGQALGGTLYRLLGAPVMLLFDGLSFLIAGGATALIRIPQRLNPQAGRWQARLAEFRRDLADGLRYVWGTTGLKGLVLVSAVSSFFSVPFLLLLPFYVKNTLRAAEDWYGYLLAAASVGSILGYVLVGVTRFSGRRRAAAMLAAIFVDALAYSGLVFTSSPVAALGLWFLAGGTGSFFALNITALMQMTTPSEIRGRVFGLLTTLSGAIAPLSMGLAGFIADWTGQNIPLIYLVCGSAQLLLGAFISLNAPIRAFLAFEPGPTGEPT